MVVDVVAVGLLTTCRLLVCAPVRRVLVLYLMLACVVLAVLSSGVCLLFACLFRLCVACLLHVFCLFIAWVLSVLFCWRIAG